MSSQIEICNLALLKVGAQSILNINDDDRNAKLCRQFYQPTVDEVFRMHRWRCATHRKALRPMLTLLTSNIPMLIPCQVIPIVSAY